MADEEKEEKDDENEAVDWTDSSAREYLYNLLLEGKVPGRKEITPKKLYDEYLKDRPEFKPFQNYTKLGFATKLSSLRDKVEKRQGRATKDAARLAHDRLIFPAPTVDTKGDVMWQESAAQKLLQKDIADGKHKTMKPKVLYETKASYYENYELDVFRRRIYQELKAIKHIKYLTEKRAEKAAKEEEKVAKKVAAVKKAAAKKAADAKTAADKKVAAADKKAKADANKKAAADEKKAKKAAADEKKAKAAAERAKTAAKRKKK